MQSAASYNPVVDEKAVYTNTGNPRPKEIENVVDWLLNHNFREAFKSISGLQLLRGVALLDIVQQIHG